MKAHQSQFGEEEPIWLRELAEVQGKEAGYALGECFVRININ